MYGPYINEELVGSAIKGFRDKIMVATKFGITMSIEDKRQIVNSSLDVIKKSIEELLKPMYYGFERRAMRIKPPFCIYAEDFNALPFEEYKKYLLG